MTYLPQELTYVGIDESGLSIGKGGLIIVAAETKNPALAVSVGTGRLEKGRDLMRKVNQGSDLYKERGGLHSLMMMETCGLDDYHWIRARGGFANRQEREHAAIASLVNWHGYDPKRTVLLIDAYAGAEHTIDQITDFFDCCGVVWPREHIEIHPGGDQSVPIINFADILALQIVEAMRAVHQRYFPDAIVLPLLTPEMFHTFDDKRTEPEEELITLMENVA